MPRRATAILPALPRSSSVSRSATRASSRAPRFGSNGKQSWRLRQWRRDHHASACLAGLRRQCAVPQLPVRMRNASCQESALSHALNQALTEFGYVMDVFAVHDRAGNTRLPDPQDAEGHRRTTLGMTLISRSYSNPVWLSSAPTPNTAVGGSRRLGGRLQDTRRLLARRRMRPEPARQLRGQ
ncbi:protein of unknown function [Cupriavidus neocaledonicus]|uniref:Uncharacterized protein n=1 Tax=Cupriavidus neocaledonicus TaxID=1040979 RepID=A0A375H382_9BURK|nr:protein of unknown function [Cupriavidus neocaledonicus]